MSAPTFEGMQARLDDLRAQINGVADGLSSRTLDASRERLADLKAQADDLGRDIEAEARRRGLA